MKSVYIILSKNRICYYIYQLYTYFITTYLRVRTDNCKEDNLKRIFNFGKIILYLERKMLN